MAKITIDKNRYTVDPLYQWDLNQVLTIYGLSLPAIPEIHFANDAMDKAIVRQATMNDAGVISVEVPNSLLQKPYKIRAYVCMYEGDAFKSLYMITIPVEPRNMPKDYKLTVDDEEVYSFNALENKITNVLAVSLERYDEVNAKYEQTEARYVQACETLEQATEETILAGGAAKVAQSAAEAAQNAAESAQNVYTQVVAEGNNARETYADSVKNLEQANATLQESIGKIDQAVNNAVSVITPDSIGAAAKSQAETVTVASSAWTGSEAPFTATVASTLATASNKLIVGVGGALTVDQHEALVAAMIVCTGQAAGSVTLTAYGAKPEINLPINILCVG